MNFTFTETPENPMWYSHGPSNRYATVLCEVNEENIWNDSLEHISLNNLNLFISFPADPGQGLSGPNVMKNEVIFFQMERKFYEGKF